MIKIRYKKETGLLTGWGVGVKDRDNTETTKLLDVTKPASDDYENYCYIEGKLVASGKPTPVARRNLVAEIDELKAEINLLKMSSKYEVSK